MGERFALEDNPEYVQPFQDVARAGGRVDGLELLIVAGPQKGKRRNERAGTDSGDYLEIRTCPRRAPTVQDSRTESTVGATAGQGEIVINRVTGGIQWEDAGRLLYGPGLATAEDGCVTVDAAL